MRTIFKSAFSAMALSLVFASASAEKISSPDGKLQVEFLCNNGKPTYSVTFNGKQCLGESPLGLFTNIGDFSKDLKIARASEIGAVNKNYVLYNIKSSNNSYKANAQTFTLSQNDKDVMQVIFQVSDNNVAYRYELLAQGETKCCVINGEATGFSFMPSTTTFMCPQMESMTGFARTAPSYETHYEADAPMGKNGWGKGYTFPCLFKTTNQDNTLAWILVSETGVDGSYCASKIESSGAESYKISFPSQTENNGYGTNNVQAPLPFSTPWRTITVGDNLAPIVESTVTWDVVKDFKGYADGSMADAREVAKKKYGRGSWSWIIANDESCNFETQKQYIDFSAAMGWESLLIDAMWDTQIGRERIKQLADYGKQKGVYLYLWYNSNGIWNDAPQGPRNCMDTYSARRKEMAWMKEIGIRGIKVDFFGGDKQCTIQLYEDILRDAQEFGIMVIFHGCTLPRGWEQMFPNYVASEAVRASENLHFGQYECDREAMDATFLPFIRNAVGSMDFGGSTLNWYYNPKNSSEMWGGHRVTSNVFALATAVLFQSPVQHFAMAPNNLTDSPAWAVDFMKSVPTTWDEVKYIDGYPGKYVVLARRSGDKWFVTAVNGTKETLSLKLKLPMFAANSEVIIYSDDAQLNGSKKSAKVGKKQEFQITIPVNGGYLICQ